MNLKTTAKFAKIMPDYPVWEQTDTGVNIKFTRILPIKIAEYEFFKKKESVPVVPEMGFY
jgi:hypothetical protein